MSQAALAPRENPTTAARTDVPAPVGGPGTRIRILRAAMIAGVAMCVCEGAKDQLVRGIGRHAFCAVFRIEAPEALMGEAPYFHRDCSL